MLENIWISAQTREGAIEKSTFGLIGEARRLLAEGEGTGTVTVVVIGANLKKSELEALAHHGADKVLVVGCEDVACCEAELHAEVLYMLCRRHNPSCILLCQTPESLDLGPRLAALLTTSFISGAVDLKVGGEDIASAVRPVANGHLYEELRFPCSPPPVISFQPSVLIPPPPNPEASCLIVAEHISIDPARLKTRVVEVLTDNAENLSLEEAEIIVLGGRGVGKDEDFAIIHDLAAALGGTVGGSRPVIDQHILPFERQIGQTGKSVGPRLLVACGVSGANELTVGFEQAETVVAINTDQRARIFRFADLGIVGNVHEVVPLLLSQLTS
jgi:electron transfer flavoprotein alpha subunit